MFSPKRLDWGEQIVVITGGTHVSSPGTTTEALTHITGASGIGELIANTLAVRNVTTVVLDVNPIESENCAQFTSK